MRILLVDDDPVRGQDLSEKYRSFGVVGWCKDNQGKSVQSDFVPDITCFHVGNQGWLNDSLIGQLQVRPERQNFPFVWFTGADPGIRDVTVYAEFGYGVPRAIRSSSSASHEEWKEFFEWAERPDDQKLPRLLRPQFNPLLQPLMLFCEAYQNADVAEKGGAASRIPDGILRKLKNAQLKRWFESPSSVYDMFSRDLTVVLPSLPNSSMQERLKEFLTVANKLRTEPTNDSGSVEWIELASQLRREIQEHLNPMPANEQAEAH